MEKVKQEVKRIWNLAINNKRTTVIVIVAIIILYELATK